MMTALKLIRWSHLALIFGGLYQVIIPFFFPSTGFIGIGLLLLGLVGLHARQIKKVGWLGHIGIACILISSILPILFGIHRNSSFELNLPLFVIGGIQLVGIAIYGAATLKAKILPKYVGYIFFLAIPMTVIAGMGLNYFLIPIGYLLWRKKDLDEAPVSGISAQGPA